MEEDLVIYLESMMEEDLVIHLESMMDWRLVDASGLLLGCSLVLLLAFLRAILLVHRMGMSMVPWSESLRVLLSVGWSE